MKRLRKAIRKVLIAILITFIIVLTASASGWGYQIVKFDINYTSPIELDSTKSALPAHIKLSLNPFFFPISYLSNVGTLSNEFMFIVYVNRGVTFYESIGPLDSAGNPRSFTFSELAEAMAANLVFPELGKNLPFYFLIGLFIAYSTSKLLEYALRKKNVKNHAPSPETELH